MKNNRNENYNVPYEIFVGNELKTRFITFKPDVSIDYFYQKSIK